MIDSSVNLSCSDRGVRLPLRVIPGASKNGCKGVHDGRLKIGVVAVAEKGKANLALTKWLANAFKLPVKQVLLVQGLRAQNKTFELQGIELADVEKKLEMLISADSRY